MKPGLVNFEITEDCHFTCVHCYNPFRTHKKKKFDPELTEKVLDRLIEEGIFNINFTGGEPFSKKDFLYKGIEETCHRRIKNFV